MNQERAINDASWMSDPLGFLLEPVPAEDFFRDHYERRPLLVARDDPARHRGLLSIEEIDAFVDSADLRAGMLDLVRSSGRVPATNYTSETGRIAAAAVAAEYLNGATIILPQLHESLPQLAQFCRALELVLSCHVQTNIYLTPPGNQGFSTHYDNHDVFVLQIAGAKQWHIYDRPVATPYRGERFVPGEHEAGELVETRMLKPGDCLYLPRGHMHDAPNVGEEPSLHITVGLITRTWADLVLEAVSELALREPAFRRSLPPGFAGRSYDATEAREQFAALTRLIAERAEMEPALELMAATFLSERRPHVAGVIAAGRDAIRDGARFRRRPLVPWRLEDRGGAPTLVGPGGDLLFDSGDREALERALGGEPFHLQDLPCPDPERLLRRLWTGGYVELAG